MSVFTVGKRYMGEYLVEHVVPFFNGELAVSQALNENYYLQSIYLNRMISTIEFERIRNWYDRLNHPLLIRYSDLFMEPNALVFISPYQALQPLPEALSRSGIEEKQLVHWMKELVELEIYLRSQDVPMFYVKDPRNIGLNADGQLKVISSGVDEITPFPIDLNWGTFMYSIATGEYMNISLDKMPKNKSLSRSMARLIQKVFKARSLEVVQRHIEQYLKSESSKGLGFFEGLFGGKKANVVDVPPAETQSTPVSSPQAMKSVKSELLLTEPSLEQVQGFDQQDLIQPTSEKIPPTPSNNGPEQNPTPFEHQQAPQPPYQQQQQQYDQKATIDWNEPQPDLKQTDLDMQLEELYQNYTKEQKANSPTLSTTLTAEEQEFVNWDSNSTQYTEDFSQDYQSNTSNKEPSINEDLFKELNVTQEELDQLMAEQKVTQEPLPEDWSQVETASTLTDGVEDTELISKWSPTDAENNQFAEGNQEDHDLMEEGSLVDWSNVYDPDQFNEKLVQTNASPNEESFELISQSLEELERELQVDMGADSTLQKEPEFTAPSTEEETIPDDSELKNLDDLFTQFEHIQKELMNETVGSNVIVDYDQSDEEMDHLAQELAELQRELNVDNLDEVSTPISDSSQNIDKILNDVMTSSLPEKPKKTKVKKEDSSTKASKEPVDPFATIRLEYEEMQKQIIAEQQSKFEQRKQELIVRAEEELKRRQDELRKEIELQEKKIREELEKELAQQEEEQHRLLQEEQLRIEKDLQERERIEREKIEFSELRKKYDREISAGIQELRQQFSLQQKAQLEQERLAYEQRQSEIIAAIQEELTLEEKKWKKQKRKEWDLMMNERKAKNEINDNMDMNIKSETVEVVKSNKKSRRGRKKKNNNSVDGNQ